MVNHQGQETYNITNGNLQNAEEKIQKLNLLADTQQQEIHLLREQVEKLENG